MCPIKVNFILVHATKAQRGVEVLVYYFFNLDARWESVVNATLRPLYPGERDTVLIGQEAGRAPGPV